MPELAAGIQKKKPQHPLNPPHSRVDSPQPNFKAAMFLPPSSSQTEAKPGSFAPRVASDGECPSLGQVILDQVRGHVLPFSLQPEEIHSEFALSQICNNPPPFQQSCLEGDLRPLFDTMLHTIGDATPTTFHPQIVDSIAYENHPDRMDNDETFFGDLMEPIQSMESFRW